jgi:hypothetical protein
MLSSFFLSTALLLPPFPALLAPPIHSHSSTPRPPLNSHQLNSTRLNSTHFPALLSTALLPPPFTAMPTGDTFTLKLRHRYLSHRTALLSTPFPLPSPPPDRGHLHTSQLPDLPSNLIDPTPLNSLRSHPFNHSPLSSFHSPAHC